MTGIEIIVFAALVLGALAFWGLMHMLLWGYLLADISSIVWNAMEEKPPEEKP